MNNKIIIGIICLILSLVIWFPLPVSAVIYCDGDDLYENITVDGTLINIFSGNCPFGCYDNITAYGGDCTLPSYQLVAVFFGAFMLFIFLIYSLPKALRKGKRR